MHEIRVWFANLKLKYKLLLSMAGVTTLALLAIMITTYQNYFSMNFASQMEKSEQAVDRAANSLHRTFSSFTLKTSRMLLKPTIKEVILLLEMDDTEYYAENYQNVSSILESFVEDSDLLVSASLLNPSVVYSTFAAGTKQNPDEMIDPSLWTLGNITYLPYNHTEKSKSTHVVPVLFPITSIYSTSGMSLSYGNSEHGQPVFFAASLDERYLEETLSRFSTSMTDAFYLLNSDGLPLNRSSGALNEEIITEINHFVMTQEALSNEALTIGGDTFYITSRIFGSADLRMVHVFSKSGIMHSLQPMLMFLIFIWLTGIILSCLLSLIIAHFLTRPFRKLAAVINQINDNSYREKTKFLYHDESGVLGKQINHMYDTIQQQILQIKQEEQLKAKAEIQMYAEQVNPHFLYNTLECIQFQMLSDHKETARLMLGSLGKYLRITLSHGQTTIPLTKEIEHVSEYMTILNRHSSTAKIGYSCTCDESLLELQILKLLLQPITENAIKHGFPEDLLSYMLPPSIAIEITKTENTLMLKVTDNGQGFDVKYAESCMRNIEFENGSHFGLRNVYQRLTTFYGSDADLLFESIPYYQNSVVIKIPLSRLN